MCVASAVLVWQPWRSMQAAGSVLQCHHAWRSWSPVPYQGRVTALPLRGSGCTDCIPVWALTLVCCYACRAHRQRRALLAPLASRGPSHHRCRQTWSLPQLPPCRRHLDGLGSLGFVWRNPVDTDVVERVQGAPHGISQDTLKMLLQVVACVGTKVWD